MTDSPLALVADVLRGARALYAAAPSHAPYGNYPVGGTVCIVTACARVARTMGTRELGQLSYTRIIADAVGLPDPHLDDNRSLIDWNATHSTEEVLAVLDQAIEQAQA